MRRPRALFAATSWFCALVFVCACNLDNLGDPPAPANIYLPTGLLLSAQNGSDAPRFMYLINSNFDLRYNRGSVQAYDLDALDHAVEACATPGPDCIIDPASIMTDEVLVPSLATSFATSPDHKRLYLATRTAPSMTFIDLDEGASQNVLDCGDVDRECSADRARGADPNRNRRRVVLPNEPVALVTLPVASLEDASAGPTDSGNLVLIAHRAGQASLFYDPGAAGPDLVDVRNNLLLEPTDLAWDPLTKLAYLSIYARNGVIDQIKVLDRVGIAIQPDLQDTFLYDGDQLVLDATARQRDTRGIKMNPAHAGQALVASHDPSALLFVDVATDASGDIPAASANTRETVPMGDGATRIALGDLGGRPIAAVSCFDSSQVYLIDVTTSEVLSIVHNLNGPFELVIDGARKRLYVADFRSSVVFVMDLGPAADNGAGDRTDLPIIATLGTPKALQELQ
jgi:DNA-binding beta-propeller fold protein YncE